MSLLVGSHSVGVPTACRRLLRRGERIEQGCDGNGKLLTAKTPGELGGE